MLYTHDDVWSVEYRDLTRRDIDHFDSLNEEDGWEFLRYMFVRAYKDSRPVEEVDDVPLKVLVGFIRQIRNDQEELKTELEELNVSLDATSN